MFHQATVTNMVRVFISKGIDGALTTICWLSVNLIRVVSPSSLSHPWVSAGLIVRDDASKSQVSIRYEKLACHFLNNVGTARSRGRLITNGLAKDRRQMEGILG